MSAVLLVCTLIIGAWIIWYPNPFHRKGRFRKPGGWNGKFGKDWHYDE